MQNRPTIGISLPNRAVLFGVRPTDLLRMAEAADESGLIDSIWVGDNLLSKPRLDGLSLLAALAVRTRNVRLGTICLASFVMRHPVHVAIQWASIDVLADGRTVLAVCNGGSGRNGSHFAKELSVMGVMSDDRMARLEEGIKALRSLWESNSASHHGKFYSFDDVDAQPKPIQPRVPIIIAVSPKADAAPDLEERVLRRVARLADGWQLEACPLDLFQSRWRRIREYADEYGRADLVSDNQMHIMVNVNRSAAAARAETARYLERYYLVRKFDFEKLDTISAFGSTSRVVDRLGAFLEAGVRTPVLRLTSADQIGQLERCLDQVVPQLTSAHS